MSVRRATLEVEAQTAAFTTVDPVGDAVRLATAYDVRLVVIDASGLDADAVPDAVTAFIERSPADVGLLAGSVDWSLGDGVCVPFGGSEHDWAALELGAWLASSRGIPFRLVGVRADDRSGRRDASRLLADAAIAVQRAVGIDALPELVDRDPAALVGVGQRATIVIAGLPESWRREGLGPTRRQLVRGGRPTMLVHSGPRPSGLAPAGSRSRFTWTIATPS